MRTYGREMIRGFRHGKRELALGRIVPFPRAALQNPLRYRAWVHGWYAAKHGNCY